MRYRVHLHATAFAALLATLAGCEAVEPPSSLSEREQPIRNGTREPQVTDLTEGEIMAIGWLHRRGSPGSNFCSGTFIAPDVVATASHCTFGSFASQLGFAVGLRPAEYEATFDVVQIVEHPSVDAALLVIDADATEVVEGLTPIAANTEPVTLDDVGTPVDASGFGQTFDPTRDGRWFASVYINDVNNRLIEVDGRGEQGICFGDSGGPIIWEGSDGEPVVLGVESGGDATCLDIDRLTRLDTIADFIEPVLRGELPNDPCDGLDETGRCDGEVAEVCEDGLIVERDCAALGTTCGFIAELGAYGCACGEVDFFGRCEGEVVTFCDDGALQQINCEARGQGCDFINENVGYFCVDLEGCPAALRRGYCDGTVRVWCDNGENYFEDCASQDRICGLDDSGVAVCVVERPDNADPGLDAGVDTGDAGDVTGPSGSGDDGGCRVAPGPADIGAVLAALGLLAVAGCRRRRELGGDRPLARAQATRPPTPLQ